MRTIFTVLLLFTGFLSVKGQSTDSLYLVPGPQSVSIRDGKFIDTTKFTIGIEGPASEKLTAAVNRFYLQLGKRTGIYFPQEYITAADNKADAQFSLRFTKAEKPGIGIDE